MKHIEFPSADDLPLTGNKLLKCWQALHVAIANSQDTLLQSMLEVQEVFKSVTPELLADLSKCSKGFLGAVDAESLLEVGSVRLRTPST